MLIVCSRCVSSYTIDPADLARADAATHCAHCRQPLSVAANVPPLAARPAGRAEGSALRGIGVVLAAAVGLSALLFWREPIARAVPGAAGAYRLAGLHTAAGVPTLADLVAARVADGLTVSGRLANPDGKPLPLPRLHISIRDASTDALYSWTVAAPKPSLAPGESVTFESHLDKAPPQGHDLAVSFVPGGATPMRNGRGNAR